MLQLAPWVSLRSSDLKRLLLRVHIHHHQFNIKLDETADIIIEHLLKLRLHELIVQNPIGITGSLLHKNRN